MTANGIDELLLKSRDLAERQRVWTASKEIGRPLKPGLVELVELRNQVAREMGYKSYFALQVADYGMTVDEMMKLLDDALATTKPLFDGLHCWAKNALAARYKRPRAHGSSRRTGSATAGRRTGRAWSRRPTSIPLFKGATPESIVKSAENFYVSLGFPQAAAVVLGEVGPLPGAAGRAAQEERPRLAPGTSTTTSDVRSLMSVEPNEQWFGTAHHELGHIYYFLSYSRPEVPFLLREGANRAFHEAVGELAKLASEQTPYLVKVGVMPAGKEPDPTGWLLQSALGLDRVPALLGRHDEPLRARPLRGGAAARPSGSKRWWDYVADFQGVVPPARRAATTCATRAPRRTSTTTRRSTTTTRWRR